MPSESHHGSIPDASPPAAPPHAEPRNLAPQRGSLQFQRLHPASLLFSLLSILRRFLIPALVVLLLGRGERYEVWVMVFAVPAALYAIVKYISLRYALGDGELVVKEGILNRTERHIPYHRIQNVDTTRNLLHRLLGVADVSIQTAGGAEPEALLRVLSGASVSAMRGRIFAGRDGAMAAPIGPAPMPEAAAAPQSDASAAISPATPPAAHPREASPCVRVAHCGIGELVRFGLISNRGTLALAALLGVAWQLDVMPGEEQFSRWAHALLGAREWTRTFMVVVIVAGILGLVAGLRLLSIGWAIFTLYDFTLTRREDELQARFGLLTEHANTIPRHRIQLIDLEATPLHRLFRRLAARARTAGSAKGGDSDTGHNWLAPLLAVQRIGAVLEQVQPELAAAIAPEPAPEHRPASDAERQPSADVEPGPSGPEGGGTVDEPKSPPPTNGFLDRLAWQPVELRARRRVFAKCAVLVSLPMPLVVWEFWPWGLTIWPPLIALVGLHAHLLVRSMGYALTEHVVWFRRGWLRRSWRAVRFSKIQAVALAESPFDRRHRMAAVKVDCANAGVGQDAILIPYLARSTAEDVFARLRRAAAGTEFRW